MKNTDDMYSFTVAAKVNEGNKSMWQTTLEPIDAPGDFFSDEVQSWVRTIIPGVVTPTLFLFGAPANIVCALVFYKQSLKERINVCLFALALTDFIALTVDFLLAAEHIYRTFIAPSTILLECLVGLTGFVFASQFLSCVIACERCFCVVSPFKAQKYLKTSTMAAIVLFSCCVIVGGLCVIAGYKHTSVLNFDPVTNHTVKVFGYTQFYLDHKEVFDPIDTFVYATAFPIVILVVIVFVTSVTVCKIYMAVTWRQSLGPSTTATKASTSKPDPSRLSSKELALTKMLIAVSVLFIVCLMPNALYRITYFLVSEFNYAGRFKNLSSVLWEIVVLCRVINCSMNFLVYYCMGSRFRATLHDICTCKTAVNAFT